MSQHERRTSSESSRSSSEGEQVGANQHSAEAPLMKSIDKVLTAPSPSSPSKKRKAFGEGSATEDSALALKELKKIEGTVKARILH